MTFTAADAIAQLRSRHPQNKGRWATVVEFLNIDFLAVGCWPSDDFLVHGYEIKVSRGDWLRELKQPYKAADAIARCDHWWLAAPPGIVKDGELPDGWGLLLLSDKPGGRARTKVKAPSLRPPLDRRRMLKTGTGWEVNRDMFERQAFAMMTRRYAYAAADLDATTIFGDPDERLAALDQAALATGRFTSAQRKAQKRRDAYRRRRRAADKAHRLHLLNGEPRRADCPLEWCAEAAN